MGREAGDYVAREGLAILVKALMIFAIMPVSYLGPVKDFLF